MFDMKKYSNAKIQLAAVVIYMSILTNFPRNYIEKVFGGMLKINDIVDMVLLDLIKQLYNKLADKHSLRYFLKEHNLDTEDTKMLYSRNHSFVMKHRKIEYDNKAKEVGIVKGMESLIPPDMTNMNNKLSGYQLTEMNFYELMIITNNDFTKSISEKRLIDSKKISNGKFKEILSEYDSIIDELSKTWEDNTHNTIFNSIAAFTLEWKFPIHFLYQLAKRMEEKNITEFDNEQQLLCVLCSEIAYRSVLGKSFFTHSRMIHLREKYIDLIIDEYANSDYLMEQIRDFEEGLYIVSRLCEDPEIKVMEYTLIEWFEENTDEDDWASFFRDYNIFSIIKSEKEWTNKRIRCFRRLYSLILR